MKIAVLFSVLSLNAIAFTSLAPLPAQAQYVAIPITNGSFALTGNGTGTDYSQPLTVLSPAGTINIVNPPLPASNVATTVTANTPIANFFENVSGAATLNDGRTATFANNGYLKLESLATVTGALSSDFLPTVAGVTVTYAVQTGSLTVPETSLSAYPTNQVAIPITGGSFSINASTNAQADTVTINSVLTPLGTANLTISLPDLNANSNPYLFVTTEDQTALLQGVVNGSVVLTDGRTATVTDRLATFTATVRRTDGVDFWYGEQIPTEATTIQGTLTAGTINVPESSVVVPQPPQLPPETPPIPQTPPVSETFPSENLPISTITRPLPAVPSRPAPAPAAQTPATQFVVAFADTLNLGGESNEFANIVNNQVTSNQTKSIEIPEVEISPLACSRVHAGLCAR